MSISLLDINSLSTHSPNLKIGMDCIPGSDEKSIRIEASEEGGSIIFEGQEGFVGGVSWTRDKYLVVPIYINEDHSLFMHMRFWEGNSKTEECSDIAMGVLPGFVVQVALKLKNLDLNTLFLPRTPGRLKNVSLGKPTVPEKVNKFSIDIPPSSKPQTIWIGIPRLSDEEPKYNIPQRPMVDEIGQWIQKDWKGKTKNAEEMIANLRDWITETHDSLEGDFDQYGGWTGFKSNATGFFRKEHDGKRWWLVDPEGHPFFSVGPDCVRPNAEGPVEGIEDLFSWLPAEEGDFKEAWLLNKKNAKKSMSFLTANLIRAFGAEWETAWESMTRTQLKENGFNTIANWSVSGLGTKVKMPYVIEFGFPDTERKIFRDFPDVFSSEYAESADNCYKCMKDSAEDPYMIGYFLRNEPNWAFGDYNIAEFLVAQPESFACKDEMIKYFKNKYNGDIGCLAKAWNYTFESFEDLRKPIERASTLSVEADKDLREFTKILVTQYIKVPAQAARKYDPNHLNLGLRWAWIASEAFYAGSEYCDVFSINCYKLNPDADEIKNISQITGLPVIIGEFHAGALDVGLPSNGLRGMKNQEERGKFYSWYVENAATIPDLVGVHYFQWNDQPVLGRFDGENCNIGLIDVCGKPYEDMMKYIKLTHRRLYNICSGRLEPTKEKPIEVVREGF